uniref:Uncharacterized protein n=1 Tax=Arundo donax TaxID=35708 RepID=A0A0A9FZH5_ARUDO
MSLPTSHEPAALIFGVTAAVRRWPSQNAGTPVSSSSNSTPKLYTSLFLVTTPERR